MIFPPSQGCGRGGRPGAGAEITASVLGRSSFPRPGICGASIVDRRTFSPAGHAAPHLSRRWCGAAFRERSFLRARGRGMYAMTSDKNETARMAGFVDVDQVQLSSPAFCFSTWRAGFRENACDPALKPPPCCSVCCWLRARLPCVKSTDGEASPQSPAIKPSTLPQNRIADSIITLESVPANSTTIRKAALECGASTWAKIETSSGLKEEHTFALCITPRHATLGARRATSPIR
jgi:hypothetical protein